MAASALTVGALIQSNASSLGSPLSVHKQRLADYLNNIGAVPQLFSFLNDPELLDVYRAKSKSLTAVGYRQHDAKFYFCDQNQAAVFPLALKNTSEGIMDISALFFRKNTTGKWQYCSTLSSFHFDAIARTVSQFEIKPDQKVLTELFVPVIAKSKNSATGAITTAKGSMELKVLVGEQKTKLDFCFKQNQEVLFAENFISRHTLSCEKLA